MKAEARLLNVLVGLLAAALFLLLAWPALSGRVYTCHDLGWIQLPLRDFYSRALASGDGFLWMPSLQSGFYAHGEGQAGMFHPWHFLLYRFLPLPWAFNLEFLGNYAWAFAGMLWLLRLWELPASAALLGAVLFAFCGFNLLHFTALNAVAVMGHLPWLLGAARRLLEEKDPRRRARLQAAVALLTGSQLLLGYPQYVVLCALAEAAFVLWRSRGAGAARWLAAKSVGALLGMIQIVPTWDAVVASTRRAPRDAFRTTLSLYPRNLAQLWAPFTLRRRVFPWMDVSELGIYDGGFVTAALAWTLARWNAPSPWKPLRRASAILLGASLILALGRYGLVYPLLARLPPLSLFRAPARHIALFHFAADVLAAIAFAELLALREKLAWSRLWPLAAPAALAALSAAAALWLIARGSPPDWAGALIPSTGLDATVPRVLEGAALVVLACALAAAAARGARRALPLLVLLVAADVVPWAASYLSFVPEGDLRVRSPPLTVEQLEGTAPAAPDAGGRVGTNWASANVLAMKGFRLSRGYVGLEPARRLDPRSPLAQRLAADRWVGAFGDGRWRLVEDALPRARLVAWAVPPPADAASVDVSRVAWTEPAVALDGGSPGTARVLDDRPGLIRVAVAAPSRQLLVVSESFHEGWAARVAGKTRSVVRAYGDYLGCVVEPGDGPVELSFEPASFVRGRRLTLLGLALLAALLA